MAGGGRRRERGADEPSYTRNFFFVVCVGWLAVLVLVSVGMTFEGTTRNEESTWFVMGAMLLMHVAFWLIGDLIKFRGRFLRAFVAQWAVVLAAVLAAGAVFFVVRCAVLPLIELVAPTVQAWVEGFVNDLLMFVTVFFVLPLLAFCGIFGLSGKGLFCLWALGYLFDDDE